MTVRAYVSPLRAAQTEQTRDAILEALAEQMAEAREEFSIPRVAKRAGVSTRTVYHHFPNREAQVEALAAWIERRLGPAEPPQGLRDLPDFQERMCRRFQANEALVRAQLAAGIASSVRARRRKAREAAIDGCVTGAGVTGADAKLLGAFLKNLIGAQSGIALLDRYGLSMEETIRVMRWAVRVVTEAIAKGDLPSGPSGEAKRAQR